MRATIASREPLLYHEILYPLRIFRRKEKHIVDNEQIAN